MTTTTYRRVKVTHWPQSNDLKATRTRAGRNIFKLMGQCIKAGGAVTMKHWTEKAKARGYGYRPGNHVVTEEFVDMTLEWPT